MSAFEDVIAISANYRSELPQRTTATNYYSELLQRTTKANYYSELPQRTTPTLNWRNDPNKFEPVFIESVDSKKRATSHNVNNTQVCQLAQMTPQTTSTSQIEASSTPK